jgi:vancomycin resistance protein YoaR
MTTGSRQRKAFRIVAVMTLLGASAVAAGVAASSGAARRQTTAPAAAADAAAVAVEERIAEGVRVADVEVGGLTRDEAVERVRPWAREAAARPITVVAPRSGRRWHIPLGEAGGRFDIAGAVDQAWAVGRDANAFERMVAQVRGDRHDVRIEPAFHLDENRLRERLEAIGDKIRVRARSVRARMNGDGVLVVTEPERKGVRLDVDATLAGLLAKGEQALRDGGDGKLVIGEEKPAVRAADLGAVNTKLGSYTTYYGSSSSNRRHNVELAARQIDGTVLAPGEAFSYNDTVGPRSRRAGWRMAHQYQDGRVVDGIGGGVCQASTTLYNAALLSNLQIVYRANHSMPVAYVRPGRDATVAYGAIDLKFRNTTGGPIYLAARGRGGRLTMSVYGVESSAPREVEIVSGTRRPRRSGGFVVTTYRVVREPDGTSRREVLSTDTYRPLVKESEAEAANAKPSRSRRSRSRVARREGAARSARPSGASSAAPEAAADRAPTPPA